MQITIEQALKLFNLEKNFTDQELKKTYHILAKKYHPDNFKEGSLEQECAIKVMQKINFSKDLLSNLLKNSDQSKPKENNQNDHTNIFEYKTEIIQKLNNIKKKNDIEEKFKCYYEEMNKIISAYINSINASFDKQSIEKLYNECIKLIRNVFYKLKKDFFNVNEINENEIKEKINYDCSFDEFYNQLLLIKKKYNKKEIYYSKIIDDLHDYKLRSGYNNLKNLIDSLIEEKMDEFKKNNYENYEKLIYDIKKEIDALFTFYFSIVSDINYIIEYMESNSIMNSENLKFIKNLSNLYDELQQEVTYKTLTKAKKFKELITDLRKVNSNKDLINNYTKQIIENFQAALKNFTYPDDLSKAQYAQKTFEEVLEIISKVRIGQISIEDFAQLTDLKFINFNEDKITLNKANGITNSKGIYVFNQPYSTNDDIMLGKVAQEDDDYITITGINTTKNKILKKTIYKKDFEKNYIPLFICLKSSNFSGKTNKFVTNTIILYYNDYIAFTYDLIDKFVSFTCNLDNKPISFFENSEEFLNYNQEIEPFKNIYYIIDNIEGELNKLLTQRQK